MFLDMGYSHNLFWSLSIDEIYDYIQSERRKRELEQEQKKVDTKDLIQILWNQNIQLLNMVGASRNDSGVEVTPLHEYYPELFETPKEEIPENGMTYEMELYKAQFIEFAMNHNSHHKGGENDGRNDTRDSSGND